jgi:hypothetical protein
MSFNTPSLPLAIELETDKEAYAREYDLFVRGVSYAAEGEVPDFTAAVLAVQNLVKISVL